DDRLRDSQRVSELRRRAWPLMLPAAMMPEILLGRTSNVTLEREVVVGDDAIDVRLAVACLHRVDRLEREHVASRRAAHSDAEHDRRAQTQREHRGASRRLGESSEEWNPRRGESDGALVDEKRHGA